MAIVPRRKLYFGSQDLFFGTQAIFFGLTREEYVASISDRISSPQRKLFIGTSDYTDRVSKWPTIKRSTDISKIGTVSISLANDDGEFNGFYRNTASLPNTITLQVGFEETFQTIFYGAIKKVDYSNNDVNITLKDRIYDFTQKRVGSTNQSVQYSLSNPAAIAWDLCTCYGGLSDVQNSSNTDIDYLRYQEWQDVFSIDNLKASANFTDHKVITALQELCKTTDSAIWVGRDGKLKFERYTAASSLDTLIENDDIMAFDIDIDDTRIVNKAYFNLSYSVVSNYYPITVYARNNNSVNIFGLREETYQSNIVWWVTSIDGINAATRILRRYQDCPAFVDVTMGLKGLTRDLAETLRLTNSFYNVSSDRPYRIAAESTNLQSGKVTYTLYPEIRGERFYLDISSLDGSDILI